MKIVAVLKQVAALREGFRIEEGTAEVDPRHLKYRLNEWDDYALEESVRLAETHGGEVVAVTVGESRAEEVLFAAMAKGAHRAIRIGPVDLDLGDVFEVAGGLAAVIAPEEPDLVLCGVMASDDLASSVGTALAHALRLPLAAVVVSVEVGDGRVRVGRELEGGLIQHLSIPLPALLTIQTGINEPRYASMRGIMMARRKEIRTVGADSLDRTPRRPALRATVERLFVPQKTKETRYLTGSPEETADQLLEVFREQGVWS
jgi:electron transfer flavoprotein beta subunit